MNRSTVARLRRLEISDGGRNVRTSALMRQILNGDVPANIDEKLISALSDADLDRLIAALQEEIAADEAAQSAGGAP